LVGTTADFRAFGPRRSLPINHLLCENRRTAGRIGEDGLEQHWQMMGALEALNGMLLFGLTTAFLFAMIQEVWQSRRRR
jgi:hypothetical protein